MSSQAFPLPPGQHPARGWPVQHYGPVPCFNPESWSLKVFGQTASASETSWSWESLSELPSTTVRADLHCVTKFTVMDAEWRGVPTSALLEACPPAPEVQHVMVWAEYGYSANLTLADFTAALLATHRDGQALTPEHGFPLRLVVPHRYAWKGPKWVRGVEYMVRDRAGFWEHRGYHNHADAWREERYSGPAIRL